MQSYPLPMFSLEMSNLTLSPLLIVGWLWETTAWKATENNSVTEENRFKSKTY